MTLRWRSTMRAGPWSRGLALAPLVLLFAACGGEPQPPDAAGPGGDGASVCADDAACSDGRFCNGEERCAPDDPDADAAGCVRGTAPCEASATCDEAADRCETECANPDADGDGRLAIRCGGDDCDDADPERFPGNSEVCDPDDHDEDCDPTTFGERDGDGDGFFDAACCNASSAGVRTCGDDCDDDDGAVYPTQDESCNGRNDDCDEAVDEDVTFRDYWPDCDVDDHGDAAATPTEACATPEAAPASCPDGAWVETGPADDCDDASPARHPGLEEACDGIDNDCDVGVDEDVTFRDYWPDCDRDMRGDVIATPTNGCAAPPDPPAACATGAWATNGEDCDDASPLRYLGNAESCDDVDNDCDVRVDEGVTVTCYRDDDEDGFPPSSAVPQPACACATGETETAPAAGTTDCADDNAAVNPGVTAYFTSPWCPDPAAQVACPGLGVCIDAGGTCGVSPATGATSFDYDCSGAPEEDPSCGSPGSCEACGCR